MIPLKKPEMQGTEISSKVKAQRAVVINPFQLSASGFHLLCNNADWVFSIHYYPYIATIQPVFWITFFLFTTCRRVSSEV